MADKTGSVITGFANQMRRDISLGVLRPGERLNIEKLKRDHTISHPSVREALALLVGEGYVSFEGKKGFHVLDGSTAKLQDMTRVRAELECMAFRWAVKRADTDWRAGITAAHFALAEVEEEMRSDPLSYALEWDERNRNFHMALAANCGSDHLLELIGRDYDLTRRYRLMAYAQTKADATRTAWLASSAQEHKQMCEAALAGDEERVVEVLKAHITKGSQQEFVLLSLDDKLRA